MKKLGGTIHTAKRLVKSGYRRGTKTPEFIGIAYSVGISQFWRFTKGDNGWKRAAETGLASGVATFVALGVVNAIACLVYNREDLHESYEYENMEDDYNEE